MKAEPFYFGPEERPLFGWLHRPDRPAGDLGVVICSPFGYEAVCAHRSLRHFAQAAAAAGLPAVRFDQDGAGDSAGDDRDPDRLAAWVAAARAAIDALRRYGGVRRVALLGVRLGATVAALAAAGRDDVAALVAVAPVVAGRAYLRELRALQLALALSPPPGGARPENGAQEAIGFLLAEGLRDALGKVELVRLDRPPGEVLILDRDDLPAADRWRDGLAAAGARVEARRLPGYVQMMLDPHQAQVPAAMIDAAISWLRERGGAATAAATVAPPASARVTPEVTERAVLVDGLLFGIQSEPTARARSGRAILLLNAGGVHHIGPNRLYTLLARRWAALGHVVLRLDGAGIGDSPPRSGAAENIVYSPRALEDVAAGVAYLRRQAGVTSCHVAGLCSGAYHAFKAAVAGQRLDGVVMINPLTFFYKPGDPLDPPLHQVVEATDQYMVSVRSLEKWRKLLRGETDVRRAMRMVGKRMRTLALDRARDLSRRAGFPWPGDLGAELEAVARRGIKMHFVFAVGDPGAALLRHQGGSATRTLQARGRIAVTTIDGPDHTFTPLWSHPLLTASLAAVLD